MKLRIGGQAVVNGVLMRTTNYISTSVRKNDGTIKTKTKNEPLPSKRHRVFGLPVIRGIANLVDFMRTGVREITWSANESVDEEPEKLSKLELGFTVLLSLLIAMTLFKFLPWLTASLLSDYFNTSYLTLNIIDGIIKIIVITLYMYFLGRTKDVRTLFEYHGAEHKSINCYESGIKLTPKNADKCSIIHPRCGTTFIIQIFLVSIFIYALIPPSLTFWQNFIVRILALPLIAGVLFEIIQLAARRYDDNKVIRWIMWPGLQFQKLTTRKPDLAQLEVAIASLKACAEKEIKASEPELT